MDSDKECLSQQLVKSLFDYNEGRLYWKMNKPRGVKKGDLAGYIDKCKLAHRYRVFIKNKLYVGARIIYLWHHGELPEIVDHKDRNSINDNIDNLRAATKSQNQKNCKSARNSSSKYLGVSLIKSNRWRTGYRWRASIKDNYKNIYIGYFISEDDAALAYNDYAMKLNGEFASLNILN